MNSLKCPVEVTVSDTPAMEAELSAAVDAVLESALEERRCGVLVTRRGPGSFTVSLSHDVPFGLSREHDAS